MAYPATAARFWRWFKHWAWTLADALPPYRQVEGPLESKETDTRGKFLLSVDSAVVEVDRATFNEVAIGESLRVRYTRGNRAVNIDRLLSGHGPR